MKGNADVDPLEVVLRCAADEDRCGPVSGVGDCPRSCKPHAGLGRDERCTPLACDAARRRRISGGPATLLLDAASQPSRRGSRFDAVGHPSAPGKVVAGKRAARREQGRQIAEKDHLAAVLARTRPHVEHKVGGPDDIGVVLDDDEGVARVAQLVEDGDEPANVARVKADARLVEDKEGVHQRCAQGGGEIDALDLAPAQGPRLPVEGEVAEAHLDEIREARLDLAEQEVGCFVEGLGKLEASNEGKALVDREENELMDREAARVSESRFRDRGCSVLLGA